MPSLADSARADRFLPLPQGRTEAGAPRRTGVEIEFGGLHEDRVAEVVVAGLGGHVARRDANTVTLEGTDIGTVEILLDTKLRKSDPGPVRAALLDWARSVVPVELVTAPLPFEDLPKVEALRAALREAGASGTRHGAFLGFGLHLNTEVPALTAQAIGPVLRAFALLEDWRREADPIDTTRHILPFVDRYSDEFVEALARGEGLGGDMAALIDSYLHHAPSRNHGLDLLPLFRHIDEDRVLVALGEDARSVSARPTWHYRLPDCRIDEAGWRLALVWNRWRVVECVAADAPLCDRLARDWLAREGGRQDWSAHVAGVLSQVPDPVDARA